MSDDSAFFFKIIKSFLLRVMICSKVMCCFPLDKIAVMSKQSRHSNAFRRLSKSNRIKRCKPATKHLPTKQVFGARTRSTSPNYISNKSSKSSKVSASRTVNTSKMEWVKFKKLKMGGKTRQLSKLTTDNVAADVIGDIYNVEQKDRVLNEKQTTTKKAKNIISIFHAKEIPLYSQTNLTRSDWVSKTESTAYVTREDVLEIF